MSQYKDLHFSKAPYIRIEPPGPQAKKLLELQKALESSAVLYPNHIPLVPDEARGATIKDVDGNIYIDLFSGISVLNFGHNNPVILNKAIEQMQKITHTLDFPTKARENLAQILIDRAPGILRGNAKILFGDPTGSDAVEASIKLAKYLTKRHTIIAFEGSYHGQTTMALAVTSGKKYKELYSPLGSEVHFAPYPYCYRCPFKLNYPECDMRCLVYLEHIIEDPNSGIPKPAAIIIEPIQGEGGIIIPPKGYLKEVEKIAKKYGIIFIVDEIQTGMGRTGSWFASEYEDLNPDIITMAKSIGGIGLPLSAIMYRKDLDSWIPGGHVGTFRGNVVAMAACIEAIQFAERTKLLDHVKKLGEQALKFLKDSSTNLRCVGEVRGRGLMIGIEIVKNKETKEPAPDIVKEIQFRCFKKGVIVWRAGRYSNVVRLLPPLVITEELMEKALEILIETIKEIEDKYIIVTS